jgi:hypothetical protein
MPSNIYRERSFFDRLFGIPRLSTFREDAKLEREKEDDPFDFVGPPRPEPRDFKEALRQQQADQARAVQLRQGARQEARSSLREGAFAQLPYMMAMLTSGTDAQLQGAIVGSAEASERQRALIERRREEDKERSFRAELLDKENRARQDERLAGQAHDVRQLDKQLAQDDERIAAENAREAARIAADAEQRAKDRTLDVTLANASRAHAKEMTFLASQLSEDVAMRAADRERRAEILPKLVASIQSGEDVAMIEEMASILDRDPFNPLVLARANMGEALLNEQRANLTSPAERLNALTQFIAATSSDLAPPSKGMQDVMALAEAEAAHLYKVTRMFEPRLPGFGPNPAQGGPSPDLETPQGRQVAVERLRASVESPNAGVDFPQELDALLQERDELGEYKVSDGSAQLLIKDLAAGKKDYVKTAIAKQVMDAIERRKLREAEEAAFREIAREKAEEDLVRRSLPPILQHTFYPQNF